MSGGGTSEGSSDLSWLSRRAGTVLALASGFAALWLLLWHGGRVLLLCFAGILFAVFLNGLSDWLARRWHIGYRWALAVVTAALAIAGAIAGWTLAPEIQQQAAQIAEELPRAWEKLRGHIAQYPLGEKLLQNGGGAETSQAVAKTGSALLTVFGFVTDVIVVLFVGFYLAVDPDLYVRGIVRLLPARRRARAREVLAAMRSTLLWWLRGRLSLMLLNGAITTLALWALGIPLALLLGILSGLLDFIPNFGPILAAIPAVLMALQKSPESALYVALFYFAYQNLDGYIFTPLVQKWTVAMPEALTIIAQVLLGVLCGGLGLLLAVPLLAVVIVAVKMLYLQDVLRERISLPGQRS